MPTDMRQPPGSSPTGTGTRILVVGPSWVGDMVMAHSLFQRLREQYPASTIAVMAPAWSKALLERMPEVDRAIDSPFTHGEVALLARYRLGRQLKEQFDWSIVLPNSFKSALVPWFAGIPRRTGWQGEQRWPLLTDCRRLDSRRFPLMVQRFVALAVPASDPLPVFRRPKLQAEPGAARATAAALGLMGGGNIMALCPGAEFGDAKQWPLTHYARLAERVAADGWQIWLLGSLKDRTATAELLAGMTPDARQHCHDLAGKTTLAQAIDLLSLVTVTVSNDSGLMHVAAAVGSPLVALYGSTSPDFTPPLADRVKSLSIELACRPCFKRTCPLGHKRCLTEIAPGRVYDSVLDLLSS